MQCALIHDLKRFVQCMMALTLVKNLQMISETQGIFMIGYNPLSLWHLGQGQFKLGGILGWTHGIGYRIYKR